MTIQIIADRIFMDGFVVGHIEPKGIPTRVEAFKRFLANADREPSCTSASCGFECHDD